MQDGVGKLICEEQDLHLLHRVGMTAYPAGAFPDISDTLAKFTDSLLAEPEMTNQFPFLPQDLQKDFGPMPAIPGGAGAGAQNQQQLGQQHQLGAAVAGGAATAGVVNNGGQQMPAIMNNMQMMQQQQMIQQQQGGQHP